MKVIGITGSPRAGGNTDTLLRALLDGATSEGVETEAVSLRDYTIAPCTGCERCRKDLTCTRFYDGMHLLYPKIEAADGLILGSPTYNYNITPEMKAFIDRLYPVSRNLLFRFNIKCFLVKLFCFYIIKITIKLICLANCFIIGYLLGSKITHQSVNFIDPVFWIDIFGKKLTCNLVLLPGSFIVFCLKQSVTIANRKIKILFFLIQISN